MNTREWPEHVKYCTRTVAEDLALSIQPSLSAENLTSFILDTGKRAMCCLVREYRACGDLSREEATAEIQAGYVQAQQMVDQLAARGE